MHYDFDQIIDRQSSDSVKWNHFDPDVLPMWVADMDFQTPDFILEAIRKRLQHKILGYTFLPDSFFQAIMNWNSRRHGWQIRKEWISFSPGVVPALNLLVMALTKPGDKIIVQPPVYFPFFSAVKNHGRILVNNPLRYENERYGMDFGQLTSCLDDKVSMLILSSPHNPTGNVWDREVLLKLARICEDRNIIILSDEIHGDLIFPGSRHIPMASLSPSIANHTITCMAPSKTFNLAGLSTSYLVIPNPELKMKYDTVLEQVHVGAGNIFGFTALEAAYNEGEEWLGQLMAYLYDNLAMLTGYFQQHIPRIKVIPPEATYMVWLDCRALGMGKEALRDFMIRKAGLGLSDGFLFGEEGDGFQRINMGCPRPVLEKALFQLRNAIDGI